MPIRRLWALYLGAILLLVASGCVGPTSYVSQGSTADGDALLVDGLPPRYQWATDADCWRDTVRWANRALPESRASFQDKERQVAQFYQACAAQGGLGAVRAGMDDRYPRYEWAKNGDCWEVALAYRTEVFKRGRPDPDVHKRKMLEHYSRCMSEARERAEQAKDAARQRELAEQNRLAAEHRQEEQRRERERLAAEESTRREAAAVEQQAKEKLQEVARGDRRYKQAAACEELCKVYRELHTVQEEQRRTARVDAVSGTVDLRRRRAIAEALLFITDNISKLERKHRAQGARPPGGSAQAKIKACCDQPNAEDVLEKVVEELQAKGAPKSAANQSMPGVPKAIEAFLVHKCKSFKVTKVERGKVEARCQGRVAKLPGEPPDALRVQELATGSFLAKGVEEVLLSVEGDAGWEVSGFVMRRKGQTFTPIRKVLGGHANIQVLATWPRRGSSALLFVCLTAQSSGGLSRGRCLDVDLNSGAKPLVAIDTVDDRGCGMETGCPDPAKYVVVARHEQMDVNGDGLPDLVLHVEHGADSAADNQPKNAAQSQPAKTVEVRLLFDGTLLKLERPLPWASGPPKQPAGNGVTGKR